MFVSEAHKNLTALIELKISSEASMEAVKLQLTTHMASISTSQSIRLSSSGIWEVWIRMSRDGPEVR